MDELRFEDKNKKGITSYVLGREGNSFVLGSYEGAQAALLQACEEMRITKVEYNKHITELESARKVFEAESLRFEKALDSQVVRNSRGGLDGLLKDIGNHNSEGPGIVKNYSPEIKTTISGSFGPFPDLNLTKKERKLLELPRWYNGARVKYAKSLKAYIQENKELPAQSNRELPSWYIPALESYRSQLDESA